MRGNMEGRGVRNKNKGGPWEELWQVLRMHDVGGKLLNGIKIMYVNSLLACVTVKGGECVLG